MKNDPDRTEEFKRENRMAQMAKLRINWHAMGEMANIERALAAGTIQDLMDEVEAWQKAMQKAERDIAELRKSMIDVNIRIEAEADFRRNPKSGNDMTTLSAIKVKTEFIMTPEFIEEAHRGGFQYQALGTSVESSLRNAVEKAKGMDILSLASFHSMRAR